MAGGEDLPGLTPEALGRAERALERLSSDYRTWARADAAALRACCTEIAGPAADLSSLLARLFRIAHDMKGQAATFGYPLVTDIGSRLCRLIEASREPDAETVRAVRAHAEALAEAAEAGLAGDGGEAGRKLLLRLE